jgi:transposase
MLEPETRSVRRLEVITGTGRRRRFSEEDKARVVEETLAPSVVISDVARRYGLTPQQLFTWRRDARRRVVESKDLGSPAFVPAVIEATTPAVSQKRGKARSRRRGLGVIEVEIDGVTVRVGRGAEAKTVAAVLRALKAGA